MSTYKLYYWNARGGAEPARIILAQAGVNYEDVRFEGDQWAKEYKESKRRIVCIFMLKVRLFVAISYAVRTRSSP